MRKNEQIEPDLEVGPGAAGVVVLPLGQNPLATIELSRGIVLHAHEGHDGDTAKEEGLARANHIEVLRALGNEQFTVEIILETGGNGGRPRDERTAHLPLLRSVAIDPIHTAKAGVNLQIKRHPLHGGQHDGLRNVGRKHRRGPLGCSPETVASLRGFPTTGFLSRCKRLRPAKCCAPPRFRLPDLREPRPRRVPGRFRFS